MKYGVQAICFVKNISQISFINKKIFKSLFHFGKQPSNRGVMCLWWVGKYKSHHFKHMTEDIRQSCMSMTKTVNVLLFLTAIHIYNKSMVTNKSWKFYTSGLKIHFISNYINLPCLFIQLNLHSTYRRCVYMPNL